MSYDVLRDYLSTANLRTLSPNDPISPVDVLRLSEERDRLRALIDKAEYGNDGHCPWCDTKDLLHLESCPAFTVDRKVK